MKGIFDTRPDTVHDDISRCNHFPNLYLDTVRKTVGEWIVYREPWRGKGRRAYISVTRVSRIETDPTDSKCSCAYVSDYLDFDKLVPLKNEGKHCETRLNSAANAGLALRRKSISTVSDEEFGAIAYAGLAERLNPLIGGAFVLTTSRQAP